MDMRKFGKKKNLIFSFFGLRILIFKKKNYKKISQLSFFGQFCGNEPQEDLARFG
jgi:hypothetical protein